MTRSASVATKSELSIDFSEMDSFLASNRQLFHRVTILIKKNGETVYSFGDINTPFGAASCTKWLGAAAIMSLVEKTTLNLDKNIGKYLPQLRPRAKRLTLRQLLSHTGGLRRHPGDGTEMASTLPLKRSVMNNLRFRNPNGNVFCYENAGFNLAGEIASRVEQKLWPQLFQDEIGTPLELTGTYFSKNKPSLAGGAHVSASDYSRFLETMRLGGRTPEGKQILSPESVAEMLRSQTSGMPMVYVPRPSPRKQSYGLGMWRQGPDDKPWLASHFGTSGYKVFIDFCRDVTAVIIHEYKPKRKKAGRDITRNIYEIVQRAIPVKASCAREMMDDRYQWTPPLRRPAKRKNGFRKVQMNAGDAPPDASDGQECIDDLAPEALPVDIDQ